VPQFDTPFWTRGRGAARTAWGDLSLGLLGALVFASLVRVGVAFEIDALLIAVLCGLLFWVQLADRQRTRSLAAKVDQLIARRAYAALGEEDLEVVEALRAEARRRASQGR
jgi:hypothetical protein